MSACYRTTRHAARQRKSDDHKCGMDTQNEAEGRSSKRAGTHTTALPTVATSLDNTRTVAKHDRQDGRELGVG